MRRGFLTLLALVALFGAPARAAEIRSITTEGLTAILARPDTPFAGSAVADVTVVEYLDFNCPYCRRIASTLTELIAGDRRIRILYKDWPIFGGASIYAARAALASGWQGRYLQAHDALVETPGRLASTDDVRKRLGAAGIDLDRLDRDLAAHGAAIDGILARNDAEARALSFEGTPGLVVGPFIVPGALDLDNLRKLVDVVRRSGETRPS